MVDSFQPLSNFIRERADVGAADLVEIGGELVALRIEEAQVNGIGVRASDELQLDDVMRRHHARVAGMKLVLEAFALEPGVENIDAVGDDERGTFGALGEEVTERAVHGTGEPDTFAFARNEGERAFDFADGFGRSVEHAGAGFIHGHVVNLVGGGIEEVNNAFEIFVVHGVSKLPRQGELVNLETAVQPRMFTDRHG